MMFLSKRIAIILADMLEVLLILGLGSLLLTVKWIWLKFLMLLLLLVLVLPGLYATIWGAPYLPTTRNRLKAIIKLANLKKSDRVADLGCGDGRIVHEIAKNEVKEVVGYEFSVPMYVVARLRGFFSGGKEKIIFGDFWRADLSKYDVLICFLLENTMLDFENNIWPKLKKGTRVVSNEFKLRSVSPDKQEGRVYLYVKK